MAKRTITTTEYTDDLDGSTAAGTVTFGFDGVNYEIDLSKSNTRAFAKALKPYLDASRKVRAARRRSSSRNGAGRKPDLAAIRVWASENGLQVSERGRVARSILEAYEAAN